MLVALLGEVLPRVLLVEVLPRVLLLLKMLLRALLVELPLGLLPLRLEPLELELLEPKLELLVLPGLPAEPPLRVLVLRVLMLARLPGLLRSPERSGWLA